MKYIPSIIEAVGVLAILVATYIINPVAALLLGGICLIAVAALLERKIGRVPE